MKKTILILTAVFILQLTAFGQVACTPDPQYTNTSTQNGIYPTCTTNFAPGYAGTPYLQLVTIVIPPDTQALPPPFPPVIWDSTVLTSVTGLPPGFIYNCWNNNGFGNSNRCMWKGNSIGCAIVTGNPTPIDVGTYPLVFNTNTYLGGSLVPTAVPISCYTIVITSTISVNENLKIQTLLQNNPNPFGDKSEIVFTAEDYGTAKFKIYNMIGTVVQEYEIRAKKGINKLELDAKDFNSGIYFYSIVNGPNVFTRKMIVKK